MLGKRRVVVKDRGGRERDPSEGQWGLGDEGRIVHLGNGTDIDE